MLFFGCTTLLLFILLLPQPSCSFVACSLNNQQKGSGLFNLFPCLFSESRVEKKSLSYIDWFKCLFLNWTESLYPAVVSVLQKYFSWQHYLANKQLYNCVLALMLPLRRSSCSQRIVIPAVTLEEDIHSSMLLMAHI